MTESELSELDAEMAKLGVWLNDEMPAIEKFIEGLNVDELVQFVSDAELEGVGNAYTPCPPFEGMRQIAAPLKRS